MLKKAGITLSSACVKGIGVFTGPSPSVSSGCRQQHDSFSRTLATPPEVPGYRTYAIVADGRSRDAPHPNIPWPEVTSANGIPSPYEIFNQKKGSPYSKRRFYELVKIYHPDRHNQQIIGCGDEISDATKLERYRLVVAANNILSDPVKRAAYDAYGAGWRGTPDIFGPEDKAAQHGSWAGADSGRKWGGGPDGPRYNATWEDWEKWHNADAKQDPIFFSNGMFAALILLFATIGFVGQSRLVDNFSSSLTHQIDALHRDMSKDLMRRRKEACLHGNKDERVHEFLKARDMTAQEALDSRRESPVKLLPAPKMLDRTDTENRSGSINHAK